MGRGPNKLGLLARAGIAFAAVTVVVVAIARYPGTQIDFCFFLAAFVLLVASTAPRPRMYGYTFFAAFLFLGFAVKAVAYFALGVTLLEPTGNFNGTASAWDASLLPATVGALGCVAIRTLHLLARKRFGSLQPHDPPEWYQTARRWLLPSTAALVILLNLANLAAAFYEIGLRPRLILPAHLNAVIAWLLSTGAALWIATMVGWDLRKGRPAGSLSVALLEALASSSTLSRASYLFRLVSYVGPSIESRDRFVAAFSRRVRLAFAVAGIVGFALSLSIVSALRTVTYPSASNETTRPTQPPLLTLPGLGSRTVPLDPKLLEKVPAIVGELKGMLVGRWIGIEGTMTVASYPQLGGSLFRESLLEDPSAGESSLYQRMAGSFYQTDAAFNFGTTPGVIAVFYYSGSSVMVFIGLGFITAVLILVELAANRLVRNPFVVSATGLALANAASQLNFPYLFIVFLFELSATLLLLGLLTHGFQRSRTATARVTIQA